LEYTILRKSKQFFYQYKTPILYSGGSMFSAVAQLFVGLAIAKYVQPNDLGLWTTISLGLTYSFFLQLGMFNGFGRELPYAYGQGNIQKAEDMTALIQTFTLLISLIVLLTGLSIFLFAPQENHKVKIGLIAITFVIILNFFQTYLLVTYRSKNSFLKLSAIQVVYGLSNIISLLFVFYYSFYGLIIKAITVASIYVGLLLIYRPIKVGLYWNKKTLLDLLKVGLPIFLLSYVQSIALTADKLWILHYSDLEDVGLYSFGYYAFSSFSLFAYSVASYVYPKMTFQYGKNNNKLELWKYVKKITLILIIIQIPLAISGYYFIPLVISTFFPSYIQSIPVMQILIFAGLFSGCVLGVNVLWSMMIWKYMVLYQIIYILLLATFPFFGVLILSNVIIGVAFGTLAANLINFFVGMYITYLALH